MSEEAQLPIVRLTVLPGAWGVEVQCPACGKWHGFVEHTIREAKRIGELLAKYPGCLDCVDEA